MEVNSDEEHVRSHTTSDGSLSFGAGDDRYADRTPLYGGAVLLRNARADVVKRLLFLTKQACREENGEDAAVFSDGNSSTTTVSSWNRARMRRPFVRMRERTCQHEEVSLDSFEFVQLLGRGSFGEVLQVKHKSTCRQYAMKIFSKKAVVHTALLRYTMAERNILAYTRHPYIVSLQHAFQTASHLVLVLQLCPGGNLQELIAREGKLDVSISRLYTAEVACSNLPT